MTNVIFYGLFVLVVIVVITYVITYERGWMNGYQTAQRREHLIHELNAMFQKDKTI